MLLKEIVLHGVWRNGKMDGLQKIKLARIELGQSIVEPPQPGELGIESQAAVIGDFAVIFMKPKSGALQRMGGEIGFDVFLGYCFVLNIGGLQVEAAPPEQNKEHRRKD